MICFRPQPFCYFVRVGYIGIAIYPEFVPVMSLEERLEEIGAAPPFVING